MKWKKLGLVLSPEMAPAWAAFSLTTPTPLLLDAKTIRVYAGFRDASGVSRIGYVDVDAENPLRILSVSPQPILDVGRPGLFDDNGLILGEVVRHENSVRLYYVGFQLVQKAKFLAFTGLAESQDGGTTFTRLQQTPVLDRTDEGFFIRALHTARFENGIWKIWYAVGSAWRTINNQPYPEYHICYAESADGVSFPAQGTPMVKCAGEEYRIGRPRVYKIADKYLMFYTRGDLHDGYLAGVAESPDGKNWTRQDASLGISLSTTGWDARHLCYPALVQAGNRWFMFYNGNEMGRTGFGCAELLEW